MLLKSRLIETATVYWQTDNSCYPYYTYYSNNVTVSVETFNKNRKFFYDFSTIGGRLYNRGEKCYEGGCFS